MVNHQLDPGLTIDHERWLKQLEEMSGDYMARHSQIARPCEGTCEWLLQQESVKEWIEDSGPSSLLLTGNAKCGKSVLAKHLLDQLPALIPGAVVCSYFFPVDTGLFYDNESEQRPDPRDALAGVLHQVLTSNPSLAISLRDELVDSNCFDRNAHELWNMLCKVAHQAQSEGTRIVCVLDGLDQCPDAPRNAFIKDIATTFSTSPSSLRGFKLFISSRSSPGLASAFDKALRLKLEDHPDLISEDIKTLIVREMEILEQKDILNRVRRPILHIQLRDKADSSYLLIVPILKAVEQDKACETPINKIVHDIIRDMDAPCDRALATLAANPRFYPLIRFLLGAQQSLSPGQLFVALSMGKHAGNNEESRYDIEDAIKRIGGPFVRISNAKVKLVHSFAESYFLRRDSLQLVDCHLALAERCVQHLMLDEPSYGRSNAATWPSEDACDFGEYAASNWYVHAAAAGIGDRSEPEPSIARRVYEIESSIGVLCDPAQDYLSGWWRYFVKRPSSRGNWIRDDSTWYFTTGSEDRPPQRQYLLHDAVIRESTPILYGLLNSRSGTLSVTDKNELGQDPLLLAAKNGSITVVEWLMQNYPLADFQREAALVEVLKDGRFILLQVLTAPALDTKMTMQYVFGRATRASKGKDLDADSRHLLSQNLALPCLLGCVDTVKELVQEDASVSRPTMGIQPLLAAVYSDNADLVKFLLDTGARLDVTSHYRPTEVDVTGFPPPDDLTRSPVAQPAVDLFFKTVWNFFRFDPFTETPVSLATRLRNEKILNLLRGSV